MSYSKKINKQQINIDWQTAVSLLNALGLKTREDSEAANDNHNINAYKPDDTKHASGYYDSYSIKNTALHQNKYNLYDIVAVAKAEGKSDSEIAKVLAQSSVSNPYNSEADGKHRWSSVDVVTLSSTSTPAAAQIQEYIDAYYKDSGAHVETRLNKNGKGYTYYVVYTDPTLDAPKYIPLDKINKSNETLPPADLSGMFDDKTELGSALKGLNTYQQQQDTLTNNNAQADYNLGQSVIDALKGDGFKNANAYKDLSDADRAAIKAALPSTADLTAWNQTKNVGVFDTLINNLKDNNPEVLERMDLDTLKGLADTVSAEQQSITERNISNQQAQLLQQIQKDPELYTAIIKQLRSDSAAGTIAGQRAANVQQLASEADANYDAQAAELYKSLFGGDGGNVAQSTYAEQLGNKTAALNTTIQGKLDDLVSKENQDAEKVQELNTILEALSAATGVDVARWADAISENQAVAGKNATSLIDKVQGDLTTAQADNRANIEKVQKLFTEGSAYGNEGSDGSVDVSDAVSDLMSALKTKVASSGYKTVNAGTYEKSDKVDNTQYKALIESDPAFINWILSDDTIDALTKKQSIKDYIDAYDLDLLTLEGLTKEYDKYNTEATKQANNVFNKAQRAYIAAITAGDAKTAEQLTRLATSASGAKGNLYAVSALSNQYKQQTGASNTGRQLATDFLNQQAFNNANKTQAQVNAANAQLKYLGSGNQQSGGATLYEAYNKHGQNKANAFGAYGKFGNSIMGSTQDINSWAVKNNIDNWNRLNQVASAYTATNAGGAAANNEAQGAIETLRAQPEAKTTPASKLLNK